MGFGPAARVPPDRCLTLDLQLVGMGQQIGFRLGVPQPLVLLAELVQLGVDRIFLAFGLELGDR